MNEEFNEIICLDDGEIDLVEAALVIAKDEYPELNIMSYLDHIDQFALEVSKRLGDDNDAESIIAALNDYLFNELGFHGNMDDYYDPRNSLLNDVIDRRCGIPISLSIIYLETGRRLGLDLEGVSFPGHFLVRFNVSNGTVILDPFFGGVSLTEDELEHRISRFQEYDLEDSLEDLLEPASNKSILERVLRNLRGIYIKNSVHDKALRASDKILSLLPDNPQEYLLRGSIYHAMECHQFALADYQQFLTLDPDAEEVESVRAQVIELQSAVKYLH